MTTVPTLNAASVKSDEELVESTAAFDIARVFDPTSPGTLTSEDLPARQSYPDALKLEAVLAVIEGGMSKREAVETYNIASVSTLKKWLTAYRKDGESALVAKKRGRPTGQPTVRYSAFDPLNYQASYYLHAENVRLAGKLGSK